MKTEPKYERQIVIRKTPYKKGQIIKVLQVFDTEEQMVICYVEDRSTKTLRKKLAKLAERARMGD